MRQHLILPAAMIALAVGFTVTPARGQQCLPYFQVVEQLANQYQEKPVRGHVTDDGQMVVTFENAETETWTIMVVQPNAQACPAASGEGITSYFPQLESPGQPS